MSIAVSRAQALAYRVAAHGLDRRRRRVDDVPLLDIGVQDTPTGAARLALVARLVHAPDPADSHTLVWSIRGAPHYHRPAGLKQLAGRLYPVSDADAFKRLFDVSPALKKRGWNGLDAVAAAVDAMRSVVTKPTPKGEASAAVTSTLPREFSVDCRVCKTRHVREQAFRLAVLPAGLELQPGTSPPVLQPRPRRGAATRKASGTAALIESYLRLNGPAGASEVAWFLQTSTPVARSLMPNGLVEVEVDGRSAWLPADRLTALRKAEPTDGVRLLPQSDGLLRVRDREVLVPEQRHRDTVYRVLGSPGGVLVDGELAGTWRAKAKGKGLEMTVAPFGRLPKARRGNLEDEAARVAAARTLDDVVVVYSGS